MSGTTWPRKERTTSRKAGFGEFFGGLFQEEESEGEDGKSLDLVAVFRRFFEDQAFLDFFGSFDPFVEG